MGILGEIDEDGMVNHVSGGTAVMNDAEGYKNIPCSRIYGWGQGLALAFLAEIISLPEGWLEKGNLKTAGNNEE